MNPSITFEARIGSPHGPIRLARTSAGLAGIWFVGQAHEPADLHAVLAPDDPLLSDAARQLDEYWAGGRTRFALPLDARGTAFQHSVWQQLLRIPVGRTTSYAAVARAIGLPTAVRAVGAAIGRNPLSIVVPCHRVLGSDGTLTGYAGGLHRKQALLQLEAEHMSVAA